MSIQKAYSRIFHYFFIVTLLFIYFSSLVFARVDDNELWVSFGLEKDLSKKTVLEFEQQVRFKDDLTSFKKTFSEIVLLYKITKNIRYSGGYRVIAFTDRVATRLSVNGYYKNSIGLSSYTFRLRVQREIDPTENLPENHIRSRLMVRYPLKRMFRPYLSGEIFYRLEKQDNRWVKHRLTVGVRTKLKRIVSAKLFYRLQKEINVSNPESVSIWGIGLSRSL